jgi:hypothetical protein
VLSIIEAVRQEYPSDDEVVQFLLFAHIRGHHALAVRLAAGARIWPGHPVRLLAAWADSPARARLRLRAALRVDNAEVAEWLARRGVPSLPGRRGFILDDETVSQWADALGTVHDTLTRVLLNGAGAPLRPSEFRPLSCPDLLAALNRLRALLECGLLEALMPDEHAELANLLWTPSGPPRPEWFGASTFDATGALTIELRDGTRRRSLRCDLDRAFLSAAASATVDPDALRSTHETTAQHLTRYFRSLTAWFDAVLGLSAPGRFPLPVNVRLLRVPRAKFAVGDAAAAAVALRRAVVADVADWCTEHVLAYMDGPGRIRVDEVNKTPVHAEAALMSVIYNATAPAAPRESPLAAHIGVGEVRALQDELTVRPPSRTVVMANSVVLTCARSGREVGDGPRGALLLGLQPPLYASAQLVPRAHTVGARQRIFRWCSRHR